MARRPANEILTATEVAAWFGQNLETIQRGARSGRIPARRIGKEWRFLRDLVAEARGITVPSSAPVSEDDLFPRSPFESEQGTVTAGMDASEAAEFLRVKEWTVRSEANRGRLPGWREGTRWRFSREELIEHMRTDEPQDRIRYDRRSARSAN